MPSISNLPGNTTMVVLRQQPSPRVFVFIAEHETVLRYNGANGAKVYKHFQVPVTCWEWDPRHGGREAKIRLVESVEGRIMLRKFGLANVHENEIICWGYEDPPWDVRSCVIAFWESNFNDHLTQYSYARITGREWGELWPRHRDYARWLALEARPGRYDYRYADMRRPGAVAVQERCDRRIQYLRRRLHEIELLMGQHSTVRQHGGQPYGLRYAAERQAADNKDASDLFRRNGLLCDLSNAFHTKIEDAEIERAEAIELESDLRAYYRGLYRNKILIGYSWQESKERSAAENLDHLGVYNLPDCDRVWQQQTMRYERHRVLRTQRTEIETTARQQFEEVRKRELRNRWWEENEWTMVGDVEDYTEYVMGSERQMYEGLAGVGWVNQFSECGICNTMPRETWEHYREGLLFPVYPSSDPNMRLAVVAGLPYVGESDESLSSKLRWTPYVKDAEEYRADIEEIFA